MGFNRTDSVERANMELSATIAATATNMEEEETVLYSDDSNVEGSVKFGSNRRDGDDNDDYEVTDNDGEDDENDYVVGESDDDKNDEDQVEN